MRFNVLVLVAAVFCAGSANAKDHLLTNLPGSLGTVQVFPTFAEPNAATQMRVGEEVEVLFTVRNMAAAKVNVTYVSGSINSPTDFRQHFQNFTTVAYKSLVDGGSDRSYSYKLRPDSRLPPRAFYVALTVFYHQAGSTKSMQSTTFFNQTVELLDTDRLIDTESFSLYITLALILFAAGNGIYMLVKDVPAVKSMFKKGKKTSTQVSTAPADKSGYLVGTSLHLDQKKREKAEAKKGK